MEYIIGILLVLITIAPASVVGLDRGRSFYPVIMIVIASYYCLFAVMSGSPAAIWQEGMLAALFVGMAIAGFRTSFWLIVAALAAHGTMDLVHHDIISNAGVPNWWPGFCAAYDLTAALYLAATLVTGRTSSDRLPEPAAIPRTAPSEPWVPLSL